LERLIIEWLGLEGTLKITELQTPVNIIKMYNQIKKKSSNLKGICIKTDVVETLSFSKMPLPP